MKRNIIIISAIIIVLILAIIAYFVFFASSPSSNQNNGSQGSGSTGGLPSVGTSTASFPSGSTFDIGTSQGTVTVNNFYKTDAYITQDQQTVVLSENDNYTIVYNRDDSGFIIALLSVSGSLQGARNTAETAFLSQLGITESDACKLNVNERVLDQSSPDDGELMGLSFCSNGAFQPQ